MIFDELERTPGQSNDVDWLAFCYVSNELSADEREDFEERLFIDQAARESVAAAVELTQAIISSVETSGRSAQFRVCKSNRVGAWQRATWTATAVAVSLAIVLGYQLISQVLNHGQPGDSKQQPAMESDSNELAEAWLEATDQSPGFLLDDSSEESRETEDLAAEDSPSFLELDDVEAPDWMMAAVSGMSLETSDAREQ